MQMFVKCPMKAMRSCQLMRLYKQDSRETKYSQGPRPAGTLFFIRHGLFLDSNIRSDRRQ